MGNRSRPDRINWVRFNPAKNAKKNNWETEVNPTELTGFDLILLKMQRRMKIVDYE